MNPLRLVLMIVVVCHLSLLGTGQTTKPKKSAAPTSVTSAQVLEPDKFPSDVQVNEFFRRMFGYDSNATWKVHAIHATEVKGVAEIIATIGEQQRAIRLLVLPGGKFAVPGDMIPFGSDPFKPVRKLLSQATGAEKGSKSAVVTLVEFSDLQCPFCKTAQPVIDRLVSEMLEVRLVFQPFPLSIHPWAMKAATFAECVREQKQGAFWPFTDAVYAAQGKITEAEADLQLRNIAKDLGVDPGVASTCSQKPEINLRIQKSIDLGKEAGVTSTPTLFINGRKVVGVSDLPFENLKAMVAFEVAEAKKGKRPD